MRSTRILATAFLLLLGLVSAHAQEPPAATAERDVAAAEPTVTYREPFRPQFHFTPPLNWMNDPNGMVYYDGQYHLFYQYNPKGLTWGHMSWGHAVSSDMLRWQHRPLAIPERDGIMAFSGSAVVDWQNTSGFGTEDQPPLVAIYTGRRNRDNRQWQEIAFSTDRGRSWTPYDGNPVLDIGSTEFRDPKVFWHQDTERWIMAVAMSMDRQIRFYASPNLKDWEHLSDFGPAGSLAGVWECPDLFELPVEGDPPATRWVLQVDVGAGAIAGGSGAQYFIGSFDGTTFTAENVATHDAVPEGTLFEDFEGADFGAWERTGEAFGSGPVAGAVDGQQSVVGFLGEGLANSFHGGDGPQGTLVSPEFEIQHDYIHFLIAGGNHPGEVGIELLIDGQSVRSATGRDSEILDWHQWDVRDRRGERARLRIFDHHSGGWGHVNVDHILFADVPMRPSAERAAWVDYGADFYAAQSWSDVPEEDGRRLWLAWMSNWQYAQAVPTHPWRSAQSIPREVSLRRDGESIRLIQRPVRELQSLRGEGRRFQGQPVSESSALLSEAGLGGRALEVVAEILPGRAAVVGLKVRVGEVEETVIGYDVEQARLFVDRTLSGQVDFHPQFPAVHEAPLALDASGSLKLHVLVDWSSVEVFADGGSVVITDLIFPAAESRGVEVYASGGEATLRSLEVWPLHSVWEAPREAVGGPQGEEKSVKRRDAAEAIRSGD